MKQQSNEPKYGSNDFICPSCGVYAYQYWSSLFHKIYHENFDISNLYLAFCHHCKDYSIWLNSTMIYPDKLPVEPPNPDLNKEIQEDYLEAASILNKSPRGTCALLRLCLQKLCTQLGYNAKDIDTNIGQMVKSGLDPNIQQVLDTLRVVGNEAIHPGELNLKDNTDTAKQLFEIINIIAERMISNNKKIEKLYNSLPKSKMDAIKTRDSQNRKM